MENKPKKISQRDALFNRLYEIAKDNRNVVIVSADMGAPSLDKFRRDLSSQYVDVGIAEQNAITIAAGLAMNGKKVFAYAIAPFITLRCYEQIKLELAAMNLPVTVVGIGAGFSYDPSGPTHHNLEDISIMRALPNLTMTSLTDSAMTTAFADISCKMNHPNYLRLDRGLEPDIYKNGDDFSAGLSILRKSKDVYIIATGNMVHRALEVSDELKKLSVNAGVIDLYTLPVNQKLLLEAVNGAKKIITLEEHFLEGGMGSAVLEVLADNNKLISVQRFGLSLKKGYCYKYGGRENIQSLYGLDAKSLVKAIYEKRNK